MKIRLPTAFDYGFKETRSWWGNRTIRKGPKYGSGPYRDAWYIKGFNRLLRFNPETEQQRKRRMR